MLLRNWIQVHKLRVTYLHHVRNEKGLLSPLQTHLFYKHILKSVLFTKTVPFTHFFFLLIGPVSALTVRRKTNYFPYLQTILSTSFYLDMVKAMLNGNVKLLTIDIELILL